MANDTSDSSFPTGEDFPIEAVWDRYEEACDDLGGNSAEAAHWRAILTARGEFAGFSPIGA